MIDPSQAVARARTTAVPTALAAIHRHIGVGETMAVEFAAADRQRALDLAAGAGFAVLDLEWSDARAQVTLQRQRTLPDTVKPGMGLLVSGLNPSLHSADAGVGFARAGNRFWPAALAAGVVDVDRDPDAALRRGIGMTDIVKRATPRAAEVTPDEYRAGLARIERLCRWLRPGTVVLVGLAGWRQIRDRTARPGWQPGDLGGRPVYVMPSTSGLNASSRLEDLVDHLRLAAAGEPTAR